MRWAVIGANGMFGSELVNFLEAKQVEVLRLGRENFDLMGSALEMADKLASSDFVVNAAAYTNVELAEVYRSEAMQVNAYAVRAISEATNLIKAKLFHISTDYVFAGTSREPYRLDSATNPQTYYGESKLAGERLAQATAEELTIFRTSWLYGKNANSFPQKIARRLVSEGSASVVDDQIGAPTWTKDLADVLYAHATLRLDEKMVHATSSGFCSWYEFAQEVANKLKDFSRDNVLPITSSDLSTAVKRPTFSVLQNSDTQGPIIGHWLDSWEKSAKSVLEGFPLK